MLWLHYCNLLYNLFTQLCRFRLTQRVARSVCGSRSGLVWLGSVVVCRSVWLLSCRWDAGSCHLPVSQATAIARPIGICVTDDYRSIGDSTSPVWSMSPLCCFVRSLITHHCSGPGKAVACRLSACPGNDFRIKSPLTLSIGLESPGLVHCCGSICRQFCWHDWLAVDKFSYKSRIWDKVPDGSTLSFGDTRISLQHSVGQAKGSPYERICSIHSDVSITLRFVTYIGLRQYVAGCRCWIHAYLQAYSSLAISQKVIVGGAVVYKLGQKSGATHSWP